MEGGAVAVDSWVAWDTANRLRGAAVDGAAVSMGAVTCRNSVEILGEQAICWLPLGHVGRCQMKWEGEAALARVRTQRDGYRRQAEALIAALRIMVQRTEQRARCTHGHMRAGWCDGCVTALRVANAELAAHGGSTGMWAPDE